MLDHDVYMGIEKFKDGLRNCLVEQMKDKRTHIQTLARAINTLDLHWTLVDLDRQCSITKEEEYFSKKIGRG